MGLLRSLAMLVLQLWLLRPLELGAQNVSNGNFSSARALDTMLQDYAFKAFIRPRTGIPYDGNVPSNLTGINITAMRLRSGSLRARGVKMYREFEIPTGVVVRPYVRRLVLVYQNLGNRWLSMLPVTLYWSTSAASDQLQQGLCQDVFGLIWAVWSGFSDVESGNTCSTKQQGHFSIVIESIAPSPSPTLPPAPGPSGREKKSSRSWVVAVSVLGGLALLVLLALLVFWVQRYKKRRRIQRMERAADAGEALRMTPVGDTTAPAALVTRTQPALEHEYMP
ncbi:hypothetical protein NL676_018843 [Syzygium grande]|nr:hypothetical protein NL676_018843 [Syzygium grande]